MNAKLWLHNKTNPLIEFRKYYFFIKSERFLYHSWVTTSSKHMTPTYHYWMFFADSIDNDVDTDIPVENSVQHSLCHKLVITIVIILWDLLVDWKILSKSSDLKAPSKKPGNSTVQFKCKSPPVKDGT